MVAVHLMLLLHVPFKPSSLNLNIDLHILVLYVTLVNLRHFFV